MYKNNPLNILWSSDLPEFYGFLFLRVALSIMFFPYYLLPWLNPTHRDNFYSVLLIVSRLAW